MTNPLAQDLGGVVRLLEKATPGVLTCSDGPHGYQHRISVGPLGVCDVFASSDAAAIAACVNFLRTHRAEIAGALRDAERLDWMIGNCAVLETNGYGDWRIKYHWTSPITYGPYVDAPRSAIDSAMQQGGGGGE